MQQVNIFIFIKNRKPIKKIYHDVRKTGLQ